MTKEGRSGTILSTAGLEVEGWPEGWEDPPRRPPDTQSPLLSVEGFEGPLDWLLEMARTRRLDLGRLSILALIDSFADAMQVALPPDARKPASAPTLARWASWTVMATQLAELRSRLLLPLADPDVASAQTEAERRARHERDRTRMLAAADWLEQRPQLGRDVFARGQPEPGWAGQGSGPGWLPAHEAHAADYEGAGLAAEEEEQDDLTELLRACLVALRLPTQAAGYQPRMLPFWSVVDATARISRMLGTLPDGAQLEAFLPEIPEAGPGSVLHRKAAHAATLIAGLELARDGGITLDQNALWQPIHLA